MKNPIQTISIKPTEKSVHVQDQAVLIEFLDANSKALGAIANLGSFIDIASIKNDFGIKATNSFLIIERVEAEGESADQTYEKAEGVKKKDIFQYPYNLPDVFPDEPTKNVKSVILSTVKTHKCSPEIECPKCGGSGKCIACEARGYNRCGSCGGSGREEIRDGKYANGKPKYKKIACSRCHGSKRITCSKCDGSKRCNRCDGSGEVMCNRCYGTSWYQTYSALLTSYKTNVAEVSYTSVSEIGHILHLTKNKIVFDDDLIEWGSSDSILFDKRNDAIKVNEHFNVFSNELEADAGLAENQRLGRVHTTFETVPITTINYSFEGKEYTIYIVGGNYAVGGDCIVCFNELPKKHIHKLGIFTRFINLFTKKKRQLAFLHIASYIFHSDGTLSEEEQQLIELLLSHVDLKKIEKKELIRKLEIQHSLNEIIPHLNCIKKDLRAVVFAWQCVMQDKKVEASEIAAFNMLANFFKVDAVTLEKLKHKAEKFGKLSETQFLKEYFS